MNKCTEGYNRFISLLNNLNTHDRGECEWFDQQVNNFVKETGCWKIGINLNRQRKLRSKRDDYHSKDGLDRAVGSVFHSLMR